MKFFWKLYLSIITITLSCFSIGGSILIQTSFQHSLQREVEDIYLENNIIVDSLPLDLLQSHTKNTDSNLEKKTKMFQKEVSHMAIETFQGNLSFCVRQEDGTIIYQNGGFYDDKNIVKGFLENERGYMIQKSTNHYILRSLRVFSLEKTKIYIENTRDISSLFLNREDQLKILFIGIFLLSLISAFIILIITKWLVNPIKKLSVASQEMAAGISFKPVEVNGNDEIAQLAKNFNIMTTQLAKTMHELQDSIERQNIFVGNFAHELKTPLTTIIGYGDMMRSKQLSNEDIVNCSSLIVKEGKRLENLSMKLLELIVLQKEEFKMIHIDAIQFFQDIKDSIVPLMQQYNIHLYVDIEQGDLYIEPDLMKTVCLNLLDNARKAIGQNGQIILKGRCIENGYQIIIKDNGCGMDKTELNKIKEAFYMVDKSRSRIQGGAGLGLAICDQIIKLHQAKINFDSELKKGTTVTVLLRGECK